MFPSVIQQLKIANAYIQVDAVSYFITLLTTISIIGQWHSVLIIVEHRVQIDLNIAFDSILNALKRKLLSWASMCVWNSIDLLTEFIDYSILYKSITRICLHQHIFHLINSNKNHHKNSSFSEILNIILFNGFSSIGIQSKFNLLTTITILKFKFIFKIPLCFTQH